VHFVGLHSNRRQKHGCMPITIGVEEMSVSIKEDTNTAV